MSHLAFVINNSNPEESVSRLRQLGFDLTIWRPTGLRIIPEYFPRKYFGYWLAHRLGLFPNKDYSAVIIKDNDKFVLKMLVVPRYFKWPFMGPNDLQFIYGTTNPDYRRLGVARIAMDIAISHLSTDGRKFWGVISEDNQPSIKWVEKVGFLYVGKIEERKLLGIPLLKRLYLSEKDFHE